MVKATKTEISGQRAEVGKTAERSRVCFEQAAELRVHLWAGWALRGGSGPVRVELRAMPEVIASGNGPLLVKVCEPRLARCPRWLHASCENFRAIFVLNSGAHGVIVFSPDFQRIVSGRLMIHADRERFDFVFCAHADCRGARRSQTKTSRRPGCARGAQKIVQLPEFVSSKSSESGTQEIRKSTEKKS